LVVARTGYADVGDSFPESLAGGEAPSPLPSDTRDSDGAGSGEARGVTVLLEPGLGFVPDYDGSRDYELAPLWRVRAANLYHPSTFVEVNGASLRSNLLPHEHLRLGPSATYVPARRNVQDDRVEALGDTRDAVLLGGLFGYELIVPQLGLLGAEVDARYDVAGEIGGLVTLRGIYALPFAGGVCALVLVPELNYASADYMNELFSVDAAASERSGLPRYEAGAGFKDVAVTAALSVMLSERLQLEGVGRYGRLLGEAADSPLVADVGDQNQFVGGLLIGYQR
jgi:outer membrane scaffolding protein for murein synthesis (MipA/OmpV family)